MYSGCSDEVHHAAISSRWTFPDTFPTLRPTVKPKRTASAAKIVAYDPTRPNITSSRDAGVATMSDLTHFDLLPLRMDPQSKALGATKRWRALDAELEQLNTLHRSLLSLDGGAGGVPPPPIPVNPKRTGNVTKLRDNGNAEYRKHKYAEAIRLYTLGIQMALTRPLWEPAALVREEVSGLLANRAQAHMAMSNWPEGAVDAEGSVEARRVGNAKGWWRRGRCLVEMGRLEEAREWVRSGLEVEGEEAELVSLLREIEGSIDKKKAP
ncbi:tetratricopeptide repeat domain containing protein [Ophiocordyceps sinensis CO18]|uniref:Tetratricopeptide repeat domain containing protein n=2 Tax=Ophiocordyceps sinensis TaxID=72228 RepID=T5AP73_OPHSC|nr:tetratricopeptide repeat domain containing protein [Ophiocordyceps sinensis CO18]